MATGERTVCAAVAHAGLWRRPVECHRPPDHNGPHLAPLGCGWSWPNDSDRR
jgi:hypothetical protein